MKYKGIYEQTNKDMLNMIDRNMHEVNKNYWKLGNRSFPRTFKAFYVNIIINDPEQENQKKHIMGPYSKKIAESIMTDYLARGECCWVEEDYIR